MIELIYICAILILTLTSFIVLILSIKNKDRRRVRANLISTIVGALCVGLLIVLPIGMGLAGMYLVTLLFGFYIGIIANYVMLAIALIVNIVKFKKSKTGQLGDKYGTQTENQLSGRPGLCRKRVGVFRIACWAIPPLLLVMAYIWEVKAFGQADLVLDYAKYEYPLNVSYYSVAVSGDECRRLLNDNINQAWKGYRVIEGVPYRAETAKIVFEDGAMVASSLDRKKPTAASLEEMEIIVHDSFGRVDMQRLSGYGANIIKLGDSGYYVARNLKFSENKSDVILAEKVYKGKAFICDIQDIVEGKLERAWLK